MITLFLIIGIICCLLGLCYLNGKDKWDNMTSPPKGYRQYNGWRIKL